MKTQDNSLIKMNTNIEMRPCLSPEMEAEGWQAVELEKDGRGNILLRIPSNLYGKDCEYYLGYTYKWNNEAGALGPQPVFANLHRRVYDVTVFNTESSFLTKFAAIRESRANAFELKLGRELANLNNF